MLKHCYVQHLIALELIGRRDLPLSFWPKQPLSPPPRVVLTWAGLANVTAVTVLPTWICARNRILRNKKLL